MTETPISMDKVEPTAPPRSQWADIWDQFRSHRGAMWGAGVFLFIVFLVLLGPVLYWNDPQFVPTGRDFLNLRDTRPIYTVLWEPTISAATSSAAC